MRYEVRTVAGNKLEAVFSDQAYADSYRVELYQTLRLRCVVVAVPTATYAIDDGEPVTWDKFIDDNADAPLADDELCAIACLEVGGEVVIDGGAGGITVVRRVS